RRIGPRTQRCSREQFRLLGEQLAITWVQAMRCALEPNQIEEMLGCTTDKHLDRLIMATDVASSLPRDPTLLLYVIRVPVLIFDAYEKLRGVVHLGINSNEVAPLRGDAYEDCREQTERILPNRMRAVVALASVLDLKAPFISRPVLRRCSRKAYATT